MMQNDPAPMKLRVPDDIATLIRGCHPLLKRKIRAGLRHIVAEPDTGKALKDELQELQSYRVGKFRIIYRCTPKHIIEIIAIGPRKSIYEETYRILRKQL